MAIPNLFESLPGLILILTPDLKIETATDAYLKETHKSRAEIMGAYIFDVFPVTLDASEHSTLYSLKASLECVLSTKKAHKMDVIQYDMQDPDKPGKLLKRYWNSTNTPVLNDRGEITLIVHETINVTDDQEARRQLFLSKEREQQALARAEQQRLRLERLFDQSPAAIAILEGPDLVFKVINNAYQELFPGRVLLHLPLLDALPELRDQPIEQIARNVVTTGETFEGKEVLVPVARHEGQPLEDIYWNFIYQALFDAQGNISGMLIFALDVTEFVMARKEVERSAEALQAANRELEARVERRTVDLKLAQAVAEQQSKRLESLFMQAPASICILRGSDLVFELVNPGYEALFPERELAGKPILEVLPEIRHNRAYETLQEVFRTGVTHEEPEILIPLMRPKDGVLEDRYFKYIQQPSYNEKGIVDGVVVFAIEITEQVQARKAAEASEHAAIRIAKELEAANLRLTQTNADLDNFIYTASHDLKAPISNIEMLLGELVVELPQDVVLKPEAGQIISMMEGSVKRFKKTISSLTEISKLQQHGTEDEESSSLAAVVDEVVLDLEKNIAKAGAQVEVKLDVYNQTTFSEKNLRSIVYNLLSNAIKYRHPNRRLQVQVSSYEEDAYFVFQVKDNGLGLSADQQRKLFTMFRRFHDHVEGTGIGLYMVKKIVENVGGKIEVESHVGEGSTFRLYLRK